jgi:hypothetical protein
MPSGSHVAAVGVGLLLGSSIRETTEPVVYFISGGASLGTALCCAWEWAKPSPRWDEAAGRGAAAGALLGAALLLIEMTAS